MRACARASARTPRPSAARGRSSSPGRSLARPPARRVVGAGPLAGRDGHSLAPPHAHATPGPARRAAPPLALPELARRPRWLTLSLTTRRPREEGGGPGSQGVGRAVYLGGGGARGRNELTGRDPPTRHCGSTGKAGREKEGGRDRDVGLQPAREATARGAVAACGGAGPALLGNLRRLLASCPREAGKRSGKLGNLRHGPGTVLESPRGRSAGQRRGGGVGLLFGRGRSLEQAGLERPEGQGVAPACGTSCTVLCLEFTRLSTLVPGREWALCERQAICLLPLPQKEKDLELEGRGMKPPVYSSPQL